MQQQLRAHSAANRASAIKAKKAAASRKAKHKRTSHKRAKEQKNTTFEDAGVGRVLETGERVHQGGNTTQSSVPSLNNVAPEDAHYRVGDNITKCFLQVEMESIINKIGSGDRDAMNYALDQMEFQELETAAFASSSAGVTGNYNIKKASDGEVVEGGKIEIEGEDGEIVVTEHEDGIIECVCV